MQMKFNFNLSFQLGYLTFFTDPLLLILHPAFIHILLFLEFVVFVFVSSGYLPELPDNAITLIHCNTIKTQIKYLGP